jgi:glyoxalase family protein
LIVKEKNSMATAIAGLHHVTAIASDPQRNLDFYTAVLGLRFVKRTINFDDPGTYHFYFGDDTGTPGTILTFFPWPGARRGRAGAGEVVATAFSIPFGSRSFWTARLKGSGITFSEHLRFDANVLAFEDPDGMSIELVEHKEAHPGSAPRYSDVPAEYAVQGFYGVTLLLNRLDKSAELLAVMGMKQIGQEGNRTRFAPAGEALGRFVDVVADVKAAPAAPGAGSVHHIAFRTPDDASQAKWRQILTPHADVTTVQDRTYFRSIYFREPGGVLYEIATDTPGFLIDESAASLGETLRIPAWYEPSRAAIEARVVPIILHKAANAVTEVTK